MVLNSPSHFGHVVSHPSDEEPQARPDSSCSVQGHAPISHPSEHVPIPLCPLSHSTDDTRPSPIDTPLFVTATLIVIHPDQGSSVKCFDCFTVNSRTLTLTAWAPDWHALRLRSSFHHAPTPLCPLTSHSRSSRRDTPSVVISNPDWHALV